MAIELIKIKELLFDKKLYPRNHVMWRTWIKYVSAMQSGAIFPPIKIAKRGKKIYVIDGWHRIEAKKYLKEKAIEAELIDIPKGNWFAEAKALTIELNTHHGTSLSAQDNARAIVELQQLGLTNQRISKIVHVPIGRFKQFLAKRMALTPAGQPIFLKRSVGHLQGQEISNLPEEINERGLGNSQFGLLTELIKLIENDLLNMEDKRIQRLVNKLRRIL